MSRFLWRERIHWAFAPAIIAIVWRWHPAPLASQLLAAAVALLACEQAWMARVDLLSASRTRQHLDGHDRSNTARIFMRFNSAPNAVLNRFERIAIATIALELCGFYACSISLGWGALVVLLSLAGFNAFVPVRLEPGSATPIQAVPCAQRKALVAVDLGAIGLVACWLANVLVVASATALLAAVIAFVSLKYGTAAIAAVRGSEDKN